MTRPGTPSRRTSHAREGPTPVGGARLWRAITGCERYCNPCGPSSVAERARHRGEGRGEAAADGQRGAAAAVRFARAALAAPALAIADAPSQPPAGAGTLIASSGCGSTVKVWIA